MSQCITYKSTVRFRKTNLWLITISTVNKKKEKESCRCEKLSCVEIWKRFRKWLGIPTGITQNVKDLLSSPEAETIFENSDFVLMLNQAAGDRAVLAKRLNISNHQLSHVTQSGEGEGLLFFGNVILPFLDRFPKNTKLYKIMTTKPNDLKEQGGKTA